LLLSGCSDEGEANSGVTVPFDATETLTTVDEANQVSIDEQPEQASSVATVEEEPAQAFWGTWRLEDHGIRTIVVNPDGTATMHVELDFFASLIYGEEMTMDLTWSFDDGILSYSVIGGHPSETISRVIADFGSEKSYRVLTMSDSRIQLQDVANPETVHDWMNISSASEQG
jgi:hypothetical protein